MVAKKRLNISKFLTFCRRVGVRRITLFESEDILLQRNEKQVLNCLLNLSKIFTKYGIEPPEMIKQEIEQEEAKLSSPRKGQRNPEKEITSSRMSQGYKIDDIETNSKLVPEANPANNSQTFSSHPNKLEDSFNTKLCRNNSLLLAKARKSIKKQLDSEKTQNQLEKGNNPGCQEKKVVTEEINDTVVVDGADLLPIEDATRSKVENAEDRKTFASNQPNLTDKIDIDPTSPITSALKDEDDHPVLNAENHDVTDVMYHTRYMDDVYYVAASTTGNDMRDCSAKSTEDYQTISYKTISLSNNTSMTSDVTEQNRILDLSDNDVIMKKANTYKSYDDVMIDYPEDDPDESFVIVSDAIASSTPTTLRSSHPNSNVIIPLCSKAQESEISRAKVEIIALGDAPELSRRSSSFSSTSSAASLTKPHPIHIKRCSISGSDDPRSPLSFSNTEEDGKESVGSSQISLEPTNDVVRYMGESGDIYTSPKKFVRKPTTPSSNMDPTMDATEVKSHQVDGRRSLRRSSSTEDEKNKGAGGAEVDVEKNVSFKDYTVLDPKALEHTKGTYVEEGRNDETSSSKPKNNLQRVAEAADRNSFVILLTLCMFATLVIAGVVAMVVVFSRT
ncbi:unnamed protein product [Clavelina lepadiformis]|uniref:Calponin-homology (CH) domain-containing protein n=1 Tax=Clavelina lepadiformis TaxID=159417 RepID=A0ABP0FSA1_CLALP